MASANWLTRYQALVVLAAVSGGCGKTGGAQPAPPRPSAHAALSTSAPSASTAAPAPSASQRAAIGVGEVRVGKVKIADAARQLMAAWDNALNAHDANALEAVYAPSVWFYGRDMSRAQVLASKRAALNAAPDFKQSLSNVRFVPWPNGDINIELDKTSNGRTVKAELLIEPYGPVYAIVIETDAPTKQMEEHRMSCQDTMYDVASGLPEVKRMYAEAGPDARPGGLYFPDEGKNRSLSLGFHHDDHFENVFFVDWEDGVFSVQSGGTGENLPIPKRELARVQAKCPK